MAGRNWSGYFIYVLIDIVTFLLSIAYAITSTVSMTYAFFKTGRNFFQKEKVPKPAVLQGWKHKFLHLSTIKVHYVETGDSKAPLLLLLHGFPEFWYSWRHQLKFFEKDYHVVAVDMRGYGQTDKPIGVEHYDIKFLVRDVVEILLGTGHSQAYIVSHDWGAIVAWYLAAVHPELVLKLVILNMPHPSSFIRELTSSTKQFFKSWYIFFFQFPRLPELFFEHTSNKNLIDIFTKPPSRFVNLENFTPEDAEAWKYTFQECYSFAEPINYFRAAKRRLQMGTTMFVDIIKPEVLIIWGAQNYVFNVNAVYDSLTWCEKASLKIIDTASYCVQQDEPDLVNEYIKEFLLKEN